LCVIENAHFLLVRTQGSGETFVARGIQESGPARAGEEWFDVLGRPNVIEHYQHSLVFQQGAIRGLSVDAELLIQCRRDLFYSLFQLRFAFSSNT
jgi:hypothetical protein